jgi:hypothetical protein
MKLEICVSVTELTDRERNNTVRLFSCVEEPGLETIMRNGRIDPEKRIVYREKLLSEIKANIIESMKMRLVQDAEKLITWDEDVFGGSVSGKLEIVLPEGVTREDLTKQ